MSHVIGSCERIKKWLEKHDRLVARLLRPGLNSHELGKLQNKLGWPLPREAVEYFQWHDGIYKTEDKLGDLFFLPEYYPISFTESLNIIDTYRSFSSVWQHKWFPVFNSGGGDILILDCSRATNESAPIVCYFRGELEILDWYESLDALLATAAQCYEDGAFYIGEDGYIDIHESQRKIIARQLNPNVLLWQE